MGKSWYSHRNIEVSEKVLCILGTAQKRYCTKNTKSHLNFLTPRKSIVSGKSPH